MIEIYNGSVDKILSVYPQICRELREAHHVRQPSKEETILRIFIKNTLNGIDTTYDDFHDLYENSKDPVASFRAALFRLSEKFVSAGCYPLELGVRPVILGQISE
jgi:hypothetical protein